jgi:hypothetical protein
MGSIQGLAVNQRHPSAERARTTFESIHQEHILGKLTMVDRLLLKGHLTSLYRPDNFRVFLWRQGVRLSEFGRYVQRATEKVKKRARQIAADAGRPFLYLDAATKAVGQSKEEFVRNIAERDGVTEGLICVLSTVEPCKSFDVRYNRDRKELALARRWRKCLHFYFYFIDPEFGLMHLRLQSWFPFQVQVCMNGREWLCRQLDRRGIEYSRYDNALLEIQDLPVAEKLCRRFFRRQWPRLLHRFARRVNPWLKVIEDLGFGSYYWVIDQCEIATDVMFRSRETLERIMPDLLEHAALRLSSDDILRFVGRKYPGRFQGELSTSYRRRPEGRRVKHRIKKNSIKMYDKWSVLRIETTINNPSDFKVLRRVDTSHRRLWQWKPMGKGIANLWRYRNVAEQANIRYLEALACAQPQREPIRELDKLCRSRTTHGKRYGKFNPVSEADAAVFAAALAGEHILNGFRSRDLAACLYGSTPACPAQARRRCGRISRLIAKLRAHGLVAKVARSYIYRVTSLGHQVMVAALRYRHVHFVQAFLAAA